MAIKKYTIYPSPCLPCPALQPTAVSRLTLNWQFYKAFTGPVPAKFFGHRRTNCCAPSEVEGEADAAVGEVAPGLGDLHRLYGGTGFVRHEAELPHERKKPDMLC